MIDYEKSLNSGQLEAVTCTQGPVLVIAGAGSGKTRTIVYRLAYLVEQGIVPEHILLLTFTRKAANQMLFRAGHLLGQELGSVSGGTFHGFSYLMLRKFANVLGFNNGFQIMDSGDCEEIIKGIRNELKLGKGDRSFPRNRTILSLMSKARNKEVSLENLVERDAFHLRTYLEDFERIEQAYVIEKQRLGLVDYDDLLFFLERLLSGHREVLEFARAVYKYVMVDEYQDTNLVQARLARLIASEEGNIMVVGDDAQSIYGFRGADVGNILDFPNLYPRTRVIRLEQNYRSTQPILHLTNDILSHMDQKFDKKLFSDRTQGLKPELIRPVSDMSQARTMLVKIEELSRKYPLHEIAVLFRAGYHSYPLEVELNKASIPYQKFGGIKFSEASHIKDVLSLVRMVGSIPDLLSWKRGLGLLPGVGPKTAERLFRAYESGSHEDLLKFASKNKDFAQLRDLLASLAGQEHEPSRIVASIIEFYRPILEKKHAEDLPKRLSGLDQLEQIVAGYSDLEVFLADMVLENSDPLGTAAREGALVLSTIHSAKGLEWPAVMVIDLVEDRFPSRQAMQDPRDMDEERRLLYVACTRSRDYLGLFVPASVYHRGSGFNQPVLESPFIRELSQDSFQELKENHLGSLKPREEVKAKQWPGRMVEQTANVPASAYCKHKIFGRGKIVMAMPPNKYKVNFPGFGLKVISGDYLEIED
ncbi:ATP-dependent helicase [Desulfonatronovibrio hydrogenovorans]|uniref:ATP-dependent helicase n=1 Tax=Desulfonatronovibrio hydrogenovorans TaxID=53245 RepID=UPI0005586097|nr:ATP-dependent helicase [Desulfonatronovibrio hydrogenovorans]